MNTEGFYILCHDFRQSDYGALGGSIYSPSNSPGKASDRSNIENMTGTWCAQVRRGLLDNSDRRKHVYIKTCCTLFTTQLCRCTANGVSCIIYHYIDTPKSI